MELVELGRHIREARWARNWTLDYMASFCGVSTSQLSKFENGQAKLGLDKFLKLCQMFEYEINFKNRTPSIDPAAKKIWLHHDRDGAYVFVNDLLRERGAQRIDLMQFSGNTALRFLGAIPKACPNAHVRLLVASEQLANSYDDRGWHWERVLNTCDRFFTVKEENKNFTVDIWCYDTPPEFAGVMADDWLISIGWYHVSARQGVPSGLSIRGHSEPAFTVIDEETEELLLWFRRKFNAVLPKRPPDFSF